MGRLLIVDLVTLPHELLLAIIERVDSKNDLRSLARACSRLRSLAEPFIWQSLLIRKGSHAASIAKALGHHEARVSYVRNLSIRYVDDGSVHALQDLNHYIKHMDQLRHLMIESPCPNNSEWLNGKKFTAYCPITYPELLKAVVWPEPGLQPALPMLQCLTLHAHGRGKLMFSLGSAISAFVHPTLKKITISCSNFDGDLTHDSIPAAKVRATLLESLTLIECNVNVIFLDVVLSLPKALKELYIGERVHVFKQAPSRNPKERTTDPLFIDALVRQADSLQRLTHIAGSTANLFSVPPGRDLREFKRLTFLEIGVESPLSNHLGGGYYPPNLETLRYNDTVLNYDGSTQQVNNYFSAMLKRHADFVKKLSTHSYDLEFFFADSICIEIFAGDPNGIHQGLLWMTTGESPRAGVYQLARALQAHGARLRVFTQRFSSGKAYIPPYMYGEEVPEEVLIYDSIDFWCFMKKNFRPVDDRDALVAQLKQQGRVMRTCRACARVSPYDEDRVCYNLGDDTPCMACLDSMKECRY